jgi:hypothetical protein
MRVGDCRNRDYSTFIWSTRGSTYRSWDLMSAIVDQSNHEPLTTPRPSFAQYICPPNRIPANSTRISRDDALRALRQWPWVSPGSSNVRHVRLTPIQREAPAPPQTRLIRICRDRKDTLPDKLWLFPIQPSKLNPFTSREYAR